MTLTLIPGGGGKEPPRDEPGVLLPTVDMLHADNGLRSRKLWICLVGMVLHLVGLALVTRYPAAAVAYPYMSVGLMGTLGVYCGSNAAVKWAAASVHKAEVAAAQADAES